MVPMDGITASQAALSIGPWSQPARVSHVIPAAASRSAPPSAVTTARRSATGSAISSRWAVRTRSDAGGTAVSGWCRRSRAYRNSSPCQGLSGSGAACTRLRMSPKR
ncbi:hypothetical protein SVIOM74S_05051 [Streptomyces violarus]